MTEVERSAHAKINLFLRVGPLRADGYHEVETLVAPISLHDTVRVAPAEALGAEIRREAPVERIIVRGGRAVGVALKDGDEMSIIPAIAGG